MKSCVTGLVAVLTLYLTATASAVDAPIGSRYSGPSADPESWPAPTRYLSPHGSDANDGLCPERPWKTFAHAIPWLEPGDTLGLLDGDYTPQTTGMLLIDASQGGSARHGEPDRSINVRAVNERRAVLRTEGLVPAVRITHGRYWNILGLTAIGRDQRTARRGNYHVVEVSRSRDVSLKRILAIHSNRLGYNSNNHVYMVSDSRHVMVEECEAYKHHRHAFIAWQTENVTYRRCYVNPRDHYRSTGEDAELQRAIGHRRFADEGFAFYRGSWGSVENCVIEGRNVGFHVHGGTTFANNRGGCFNRFLGCIALNTFHASRVDARPAPDGAWPAIGNYFKDFLVVGSHGGIGLWYSTVNDQLAENVTIYRGAGTGFQADSRSKPPCKAVVEWGGCKHVLRNALVFDREGGGIVTTAHYQFLVEYSNAWNNAAGNYRPIEPIDDDDGNIRRSMSVEPTGMGLEPSQAIVFVPEGSNMKGAGKDGADIGANLLYRYVDGGLTEEPLWDPTTGAFPHGALVQGINDVAGDSLFDLHTRLNIGGSGAPLPYAR